MSLGVDSDKNPVSEANVTTGYTNPAEHVQRLPDGNTFARF
jgi:hypothetical protein